MLFESRNVVETVTDFKSVAGATNFYRVVVTLCHNLWKNPIVVGVPQWMTSNTCVQGCARYIRVIIESTDTANCASRYKPYVSTSV